LRRELGARVGVGTYIVSAFDPSIRALHRPWRSGGSRIVDKNVGRSAIKAGLQAVSLETPHMTKSERLHRWANNLELRKKLELIDDAAHCTRDESSARAGSSPLTVAFEDWAFQAEGLRSDRVGDGLAFFDLSEDEMQRIVGSSDYGRRTLPAAIAAARVRALAERDESTTVPQVGVLIVGASVAAALGLVLVAS
jgi:hypothetical protein